MLIIALVVAVIALALLVFAVVTSNVLLAWACIAASVLGVVLLIIDALRERQRREAGTAPESGSAQGHELGGEDTADYPDDTLGESDDASAPEEDSGSEADAADSVSDDHNSR